MGTEEHTAEFSTFEVGELSHTIVGAKLLFDAPDITLNVGFDHDGVFFGQINSRLIVHIIYHLNTM